MQAMSPPEILTTNLPLLTGDLDSKFNWDYPSVVTYFLMPIYDSVLIDCDSTCSSCQTSLAGLAQSLQRITVLKM